MEQAGLRKKPGLLIQGGQSLSGCGKTISAQQRVNGPRTSCSLHPLSADGQLADRDAVDMSFHIESRD